MKDTEYRFGGNMWELRKKINEQASEIKSLKEQLEKERDKKKEIGLFLKGIIRRDWHLESITDRARDLETVTKNQE